MSGDQLRNRGKAAAADATVDSIRLRLNQKKDPQARFNTPKAKRYRWVSIKLQRVFMSVMLMVCLSKEDFGTAFGANTGINRVHLSPISVLACATHYTPYLGEGRVKTAMMTLVRNAGVMGEFYKDFKGAMFDGTHDDTVAKGNKEADSKRGPRSLSQNLESSTTFLKRAKYDKGLVKIVKDNYALSASSLLLVLFALFGIGSPEWGLPSFGSALAVFFVSARSQEGSPQATTLFMVCLALSTGIYFVRDTLSEWGVESEESESKPKNKQKAKASSANDEWNDGFGSK